MTQTPQRPMDQLRGFMGLIKVVYAIAVRKAVLAAVMPRSTAA